MSISNMHSILLKRACEATDGYVCYHLSIPAVIGIVFGATFVLLTGIIITFVCCKMRKRGKKNARNGNAEDGSHMWYQGEKRSEALEFNPNAY
jgi:hypothetical protein